MVKKASNMIMVNSFFSWLACIGIFLTIASFAVGDETTPAGWDKYDGAYYKLFTEGRNWFDSQKACEALGGNLASIHDERVIKYVFKLRFYLRNDAYRSWIGLKKSGDSFTWSDGSVLDYQLWAPNEPSYGGENEKEDCVELLGYEVETWGSWNDNVCYKKKPFVCQVNSITASMTKELPPIPEPEKCKGVHNADWFTFEENCYFLSDVKTTWLKSRAYCRGQGGELVSVSSKEEINFLVHLLTSKENQDAIWTGLSQVAGRGFTWVNREEPFVIENWSENEPADLGYDGCVRMNPESYRWKNGHCNIKAKFICERSIWRGPAHDTTQYKGSCPKDFFSVGFTNICYFQSSDKATWDEARQACQAIDWNQPVDIASINSLVDQHVATILMEVVNETSDVWIGLRSSDSDSNELSEWADNSPVYFDNWDYDHENWDKLPPGEPKCVKMKAGDDNDVEKSRWIVESCSDQNAFLCETTKDATQDGADTAFQILDVSPTAKKTNFVLYRENKNWYDARASCHRSQGELASVTNSVELAVFDLLLLKSEFQNNSLWIGLHFIKLHHKYEWSDGSEMVMDFWGMGKPDLIHSEDKCISTDFTGKWADQRCEAHMPYMCQKRTELAASAKKKPVPETWDCSSYKNATAWGDFCYVSKPKVEVTFLQAVKGCMDMDMEIVSIHSIEEAQFVATLSKQAMGLPDAQPPILWIGLVSDYNGGFRWMDRSVLDFEYWNHGHAFMEHNSSRLPCGMMFGKGMWSDVPCDFAQFGYVCKGRKAPGGVEELSGREDGLSSRAGGLSGGGGGLSGGAIAGIVIMVIIVAALGVAGFVLYRQGFRISIERRVLDIAEEEKSYSNPSYSKGI